MTKGITRIVLDVEWDGVVPGYGAEGTQDCGTVVEIMDTLKTLIEEGKLQTDYYGQIVTATKANWISYVTNAAHAPSYIPDGKALHPVLRESKGMVGAEKTQTPVVKKAPAKTASDVKKFVDEPTWITANKVLCTHPETGEQRWFLHSDMCADKELVTYPQPWNTHLADYIWECPTDEVYWTHAERDYFEDYGWDLSAVRRPPQWLVDNMIMLMHPETGEQRWFINATKCSKGGHKYNFPWYVNWSQLRIWSQGPEYGWMHSGVENLQNEGWDVPEELLKVNDEEKG